MKLICGRLQRQPIARLLNWKRHASSPLASVVGRFRKLLPVDQLRGICRTTGRGNKSATDMAPNESCGVASGILDRFGSISGGDIHPPTRRFASPVRRNRLGSSRQTEKRHVVVDALEIAGANAISLVPYTDVAAACDGTIERSPRRAVRALRILGVALEMVEGAPILKRD